MKQLSIEEKAKAYDEAFEIARLVLQERGNEPDGASILSELFPELAESEDERIRKELINFCKIAATGQSSILIEDANQFNRWAAWLEKQGEQKSIDPDTLIQQRVDALADIVAEQNPVDKVEPKFKVGQTIKKEGFNLGFTIVKIEDCFYYNDMGDYFPFTDQDNWELVEQKPVEWSEDDEDNILHICCWLNEYGNFLLGKSEDKSNRIFKTVDWLKSIKDRCLPQQQEWSEEDEKMLKDITDSVTGFDVQTGTIMMQFEKHQAKINWLKSLRSQILSNMERNGKNWKPTEEQIRVIERLRTCLLEDVRGNDIVILDNLLEQLKAL